MITPKLEELILCGKAFAKTFVAANTKSVINIENDRFIIITDITFLPTFNNVQEQESNDVVQISILGERGFNHYMFKNRTMGIIPVYASSIDQTIRANGVFPADPQTINTYLLHTTEVAFSFINRPDNQFGGPLVVTPYNNPAYQSLLDYGKEGDPVTVPISQIVINDTLRNFVMNPATGIPAGGDISNQYQYPAQVGTRPGQINGQTPAPYILNVNYVEILGQPNNIGI
jgi:hypothetical protein